MKHLFLAVALLFATITFSQDSSDRVSTYVAAGVSMTNSADFMVSSYPSVEFGFMYKNISTAGVFGRNNLDGMFNNDNFNNYWYEGKVAVSFPLGFVSGYGVLGVGNYIGTKHVFLEYGGGISKEIGRFGTFIQVSNWDGTMYLTPGVSITL